MEQLLSPSFHNALGGGSSLCVGSSLSWAKGEEKRDKMTTLCLSSKSSGGAEVFKTTLEIVPRQVADESFLL